MINLKGRNGYRYLIGSEELFLIRLYPLKRCVFIARQNDIITSNMLNSLVTSVEESILAEETTCNCGLNGSCKCMLTSSCFNYRIKANSIHFQSHNFLKQLHMPQLMQYIDF